MSDKMVNDHEGNEVIKASDFVSPMDLAPVDVGQSATTNPAPTPVGEQVGFSTPMDLAPAEPPSPPPPLPPNPPTDAQE